MVLCRALVHAGDVLERYTALRTGRVLIDQPLTKRVLPGHAGERTLPDTAGQHALTVVQLRGVRHGVGWLELRPLTGRKHQLRAHCAWTLGTPIVGDGKYRGGREEMGSQGTAMRAGLPRRVHLHCRSLAFPHPFGGRIDVQAPLPPHMLQSWASLGFARDQDTQ